MVYPSESLPPLPLRSEESHKGTYGTTLLIGGSRGMSGSIALAGLAALRAGCGLTFLACPASSQPVIAGYDPSYLTIPLPEDEAGRLNNDALNEIRKQARTADAIGIGPGLGQSRDLELLMLDLYKTCEVPLVVDADGLNNLAKLPEGLPEAAAARILTPHPGEMSRLTGTDTKSIQSNREDTALEFARKHHCIVVLKGHQTVVTDGETVYINTSGNNGMATGGTGDVLTGTITSLLAQGIAPFDAARLGTYLHGLAGDIAAEKIGEDGLIASDLPSCLAAAIRRHRSH